MKATKLLPILAVVLCVPGIALRALHLLNGFDVSTGLPTAGDKWIWFVIALFAISAIVYAVLALPLKTRNKVPFEQLIGTKETLFRMAAVVAGLIVAAGSLGYLYLTITTAEQDVAAWARVLEIVYAIMGVLTGGCMIGLAKAQGAQMTEKSAAMTLVPLFWSCLHLLVNYRMTCTDPKLASFGFGLVADVMLVLGHSRQLVLEPQCLILQAARVKEPLKRQTALFVPRTQLLLGRIVLLDITLVKRHAALLQPRLRLLAGRAFGIAYKQHFGVLPC